jgi:HPt (histidine-containing phosphotransfer) domain-containing protein
MPQPIDAILTKMPMPVPDGCTTMISTLPTDDPDFREAVQLFVAELPRRLDRLEQLLRDENWGDLLRCAHWIKGAGGTAGFPAFTAPAAQLEELARGKDLPASREAIAGLRALALRIQLR